MSIRKDRRVERTRTALIDAFNELFLTCRNQTIRVADIVEHANVGRSTFYEHYASADDLFMQALARPLSILADAAAGKCGPERLKWLLDHFWENRQRARTTFGGPKRDQITRLLSTMLEERLSDCGTPVIPMRLAAVQLAEAPMALIRSWISAEGSCTPERLAQTICETSARLRSGLFRSEAPDRWRESGKRPDG